MNNFKFLPHGEAVYDFHYLHYSPEAIVAPDDVLVLEAWNWHPEWPWASSSHKFAVDMAVMRGIAAGPILSGRRAQDTFLDALQMIKQYHRTRGGMKEFIDAGLHWLRPHFRVYTHPIHRKPYTPSIFAEESPLP